MKKLSDADIRKLNTKRGLRALLMEDEYNPIKAVRFVDYTKKLKKAADRNGKAADLGLKKRGAYHYRF